MADESITGPRSLVPMNDLYETDLLLWSERQAELLRRVAAGERVNDQVDWENLVEEIDSVGRNELREVESLLVQAIAHTLTAEAWPLSRDVARWRAEARRFRGDAAARFTPAMRQRLDMIADLASGVAGGSRDDRRPGAADPRAYYLPGDAR